jgi:orotidine-5'-phosphate decarboxylase
LITVPSPNHRIIFPLDLPTAEVALKFAKLLKGRIFWHKVGLQLFVREGPDVLKRIRDVSPEASIFLDLKLHDIPATVANAVRNLSELEADLATVHAQGGPEMLSAAVKNAGKTKILAVTLLTSLAPAAMAELAPEFRAPGALVLHLAKRALASSCHGIVAGADDVARIRKVAGPEPLIVVPGIRPSWAEVDADDQKRTGTPAGAIADGADLLVIGRPIRDAADPAKAADLIAEEISGD